MPEESCCAILVAAGNSSRMGMGMSKQFLLLGGKPVIVHTLLAFERAASISSIVVVCRPEDQVAVRCLADQHAIGKLCAVVAGGSDPAALCRCGTGCRTKGNGVFGYS